MASTTFIDFKTPIEAAWLNDVNNAVYGIIPGLGKFSVVNTIALLRLLNKTQNQSAMVVSYTTLGDGGGGFYALNPADVTSLDNGGTIIVGADGGRWYLQQLMTPSTGQFGVFPSVTDNTPQLNQALSVSSLSNVYRLPNTVVPFASTLQLTTTGQIIGSGQFSGLKPSVGFSGNNIHVAPLGPAYMLNLEKFLLGDPNTGTRAGTNGIFLDTSILTSNLPKFTLRDTFIGSGTGTAILGLNNPANNPNGGLYASNIENNFLTGGVNFQSTGDSNTIHKNVISGNNVGIYASNTAGASLLTMVDNNITTAGGALQIDAGSRFKFLRNNCEQTVPFTGGASYMANISGANGTMSTPEIRGNHFGLFGGIANSGVIHLNNTVAALVANNTILNSNASATGIVVDFNCVNTQIGPNTFGSSITNPVVDNGIGTMGVIKSITTFANAWANSSAAPTAAGRFMKDNSGIVHLGGKLANGTTTSGTLMFTLPVGFRPDQPVAFPVLTYAGAALTMGEVRIDTGGNVIIIAGNNTSLSLDGLSFMAQNLAHSISDL